jgi:hypothetical protein
MIASSVGSRKKRFFATASVTPETQVDFTYRGISKNEDMCLNQGAERTTSSSRQFSNTSCERWRSRRLKPPAL